MADRPNKEQWAEIERSLASLHDGVHLRCDGFHVFATLVRISTTRLAISVYVNGCLLGAWLRADSDAPESRFYPLRSRLLHSTKEREMFAKAVGKRRAAKSDVMTRRFQYRQPYFRTPKSLIRHLKSACQTIEIVDADTAQAEIAAAKAQREAHNVA